MRYVVLDGRGYEIPGQPFLGWASESEAQSWAEDQDLEDYTIKPLKPRLGTTLEGDAQL